jgi:hypothetical protein
VAGEAPRALRERLLATPRRWQLTLVRNASDDNLAVQAIEVAPGGTSAPTDTAPDSAPDTAHNPALRWPPDVVSLSHVALPFRPDDPVYGVLPGSGAHGLPSLGALALRGEEGALQFPLGSLARLRSNPFWPLVERQLQQLVAADLARAEPAQPAAAGR